MNPVLHWNAVLLEASRRDFTRGFNNMQQPGPIATSRAMAIVHLAIHDAVAFRNRPGAAYLNKKGVAHGLSNLASGAKLEHVIAGAATTTLKALYPRFEQMIDDATPRTDPGDFAAGVAIGNAMLAARASDGGDQPIVGPQPLNPVYGQHRADPFAPNQIRLGPNWGSVDRFLNPARQHLDPFPGNGQTNYLADPAYQADYIEVRDLGASSRGARTSEQERIGVYWGYDGANNLGVPPRLYNQVARTIVQQVTPEPGLGRTAEIFATLNAAMADAGIDAWHWKYFYDLWRPVVGIREEVAPERDCFWAPLGAPQTNGPRGSLTPPFPAYPSGHATFGAALMQTLRLALNANAGPITLADVLAFDTPGAGASVSGEEFAFVSDELDGVAADPDGSVRTRVPHEFGSYAEAIWENAVSRVYLGVHFRFDGLPRDATENVGGVPLGLAIGQEAHDFFNNNGPSLGPMN